MKLSDVQQYIESWAPIETGWKGDNSGVQIGRTESQIANILLALDVSMDVAREAVAKRANLIVTHHPLLFHPLRSVTPKTRNGEIALYLAEHKINLYAAHTNLDSVSGGVNFSFASVLGLRNVRVLAPMKESMSKIVTFVPAGSVERVAEAMHAAGGGKYSKYERCSFRTNGSGTFKGLPSSRPFVGKSNRFETTEETKLEMIVPSWSISPVIAAMIDAHPYEEVAYDVYPLSNPNPGVGLGAIGDLPRELSGHSFLSFVKKRLGAAVLRYCGNPSRRIKNVALCGGAGSELVDDAIQQHADAFVTSDVKYHTFQNVERDILLIDAGHFETERHILGVLARRLGSLAQKSRSSSKIFITRQRTNPVRYC